MSQIQIFNRDTIQNIVWPNHLDADYAQRVLVPLMTQGTQAFIENINVEIQVLKYQGLILPIIFSNPVSKIKNSYVCSPTTHYIDYARVEVALELADYPILRQGLEHLITGIGKAFQLSRFEKVIYVNNWLLSTNLYPDFQPQDLLVIRDFLLRIFPEHALMFRSVNLELNNDIYETLKAAGFVDIISRQVYILDPKKGCHRKKKSFKEDKRLARKSPYEWVAHDLIQNKDVPRLRELYNQLYLDKYSHLNPQFNELFIRESLKYKWLNYWALIKDGQIDAVIGYFERNGVMTTPLVGYDFSVSRKAGLYRLITLKLIEESEAKGWVLNASSGASGFKRTRGCEPSLEFNLVYYRHLPLRQQWPWQSLKALSRTLAEPILEKFEL